MKHIIRHCLYITLCTNRNVQRRFSWKILLFFPFTWTLKKMFSQKTFCSENFPLFTWNRFCDVSIFNVNPLYFVFHKLFFSNAFLYIIFFTVWKIKINKWKIFRWKENAEIVILDKFRKKLTIFRWKLKKLISLLHSNRNWGIFGDFVMAFCLIFQIGFVGDFNWKLYEFWTRTIVKLKKHSGSIASKIWPF